jgi:hypothetical protein
VASQHEVRPARWAKALHSIGIMRQQHERKSSSAILSTATRIHMVFQHVSESADHETRAIALDHRRPVPKYSDAQLFEPRRDASAVEIVIVIAEYRHCAIPSAEFVQRRRQSREHALVQSDRELSATPERDGIITEVRDEVRSNAFYKRDEMG